MRMGQHPPHPGYPPVQYVQGPPAKRQRQYHPNQAGPPARAPQVLPHDKDLEDAEDLVAGDLLDYTTPAMLSKARFTQHHQWLGEVFSSIHPISSILPEDLNFGLTGELADLTKDILISPTVQGVKKHPEDPESVERELKISVQEYKHLEAEKMAEFEQRIKEFTEEKNKEMSKMKERHAKIMSRVNKGKYYLDAEERLREAGLDAAKIDEIVREVELTMGVALHERGSVVCVQRDDFEVEDEEKAKKEQDTVDRKTVSPITGDGSAMVMDDNGARLLDEFTSTNDEFGDAVNLASVGAEHGGVSDGIDLMDTMDLDVPIPEAAVPDAEKKDDDWVVVNSADGKPSASPQPPAAIPAASVGTAPSQPSIIVPPVAAPVASLATEAPAAPSEDLVASMFDDEADFSAFDGLDAGPSVGAPDFSAGDDLLNFDDTEDSGPSAVASGAPSVGHAEAGSSLQHGLPPMQ
jgi:hypothetical protein